MAYDGGKKRGGSLQKGVITNPVEQAIMKGASYGCTAAIHACNKDDNQTSSCTL